MERRIPWPTPSQEMLIGTVEVRLRGVRWVERGRSVRLSGVRWLGRGRSSEGRRVRNIQMATMLKGRVMKGRSNVPRRLLRALPINTLQQSMKVIYPATAGSYLATAPMSTDSIISNVWSDTSGIRRG